MKVVTLQQHIFTLATLEETDAPVISCYLNLGRSQPSYRDTLGERAQALRKALPERERGAFEEALQRVEAYVEADLPRDTSSLALFSRGGSRPFFLPLQFQAPLPAWISVSRAPNIYHLVELKDNYDRYVVVLASEENIRVLGINLGSITEDILHHRPELRRRAGKEWTREHFQDHRRERTRQFIREQVRVLEHLMSLGGYGHLILAGPARMTAGIRQALPKALSAKLVDVVTAAAGDPLRDVVAATVQSFLEHEENDSRVIVERLLRQIHTHGMAVAGTRASLRALEAGQADVLVLAKQYCPGHAKCCRTCEYIELDAGDLAACPNCYSDRWRQFDIKEEMARCAERMGCQVEVVEHSGALMALGGVGCLLRYAAPANYRTRVA